MEPTIIASEPTGSEAPVAPAAPEVPEKFRNEDGSLNQDALLKSYSHLEQKLGSNASTDSPERVEAEVPQAEQTETDAGADPYGPVVSTALSDAGLNPTEVNAHWEKTGELSEDHYSALDKAGFDRAMVDTYLDGLRGRQTVARDITQGEIDGIKKMVGGQNEYTRMMTWAKTNLPKEEQESFHGVLENGSVEAIRWAVTGLYSAFTSKHGARPKLTHGSHAPDAPAGFRSKDEMTAAMRDPRYGKDPAYTKDIEAKVGASSFFKRGR